MIYSRPPRRFSLNQTTQLANHITILLVDDEKDTQSLISYVLSRTGYQVIVASNGQEALTRLAEVPADLVISDVMMGDMDGFTLLKYIRENPATKAIPFILLSAKASDQNIVTSMNLGADDYLPKPFKTAELLARVRARIERPPVPREQIPFNFQVGLLTEPLFNQKTNRELTRVNRGGATGYLAYLHLDELSKLWERFGTRFEIEITRQVGVVLLDHLRPLDIIGYDSKGRFTLLLPQTSLHTARQHLQTLSRQIIKHIFWLGNEPVRLTPIIGFAQFGIHTSASQVQAQALVALDYAASQLDLQPLAYHPRMQLSVVRNTTQGENARASLSKQWANLKNFLRLPFELLLTLIIGFLIPSLFYIELARLGIDISLPLYLAIALTGLATGATIWLEGLLASGRSQPPVKFGGPPPVASAIISAYLPNEAATIIETVQSFLRLNYPGPLQIILTYNTPHPLPVKEALQALSRFDPRFTLLRVEGSNSKAQNINAALAHVKGEFVGIFDADQRPEPDSFLRAWLWLSNGFEVVQGRIVIRNAAASWLARMIAVEYEANYGVSRPGRAKMHRFSIFSGYNGFWKSDLLRQIRLQGLKVTADIDAAIRLTEGGYRVAFDPELISRGLAPVTLRVWWQQRMRWSQGWFEVALKHLRASLASQHLSIWQKLGLLQVLAWREIQRWLSFQILALSVFWVWKYAGSQRLDWLVALGELGLLSIISSGLLQTGFAYYLAESHTRQHKSWFVFYLVFSALFYTPCKAMIARIAQVKELLRDRPCTATLTKLTFPKVSQTNQVEGQTQAEVARTRPTEAPARPPYNKGTILLIDNTEATRRLVSIALRHSGFEVTLAASGQEALAQLSLAVPDLIICDLDLPDTNGLRMLKSLRESAATSAIPFILLAATASEQALIKGLSLGADDYLAKPIKIPELLARVRTRMERPPVPRERVNYYFQTGLLTEALFEEEVDRELTRVERGGPGGYLAYLALDELPNLRERFGERAAMAIVGQLTSLLTLEGRSLDLLGRNSKNQFMLLLPETEPKKARQHLQRLTERVVHHTFTVWTGNEEPVRLTPTIGYTLLGSEQTTSVELLVEQAQLALSHAAAHLDLQPILYNSSMAKQAPAITGKLTFQKRMAQRLKPWQTRLRLPLQLALTGLVSLVIPFLCYMVLYKNGIDIVLPVYIGVVIALLGTAYLIWIENLYAIEVIEPPTTPGSAYPAASAIIAAYLPNEAATIVETVESFLQLDYPGPFQIILAYNTPRQLPVEEILREIAKRDPRFVPVRVLGSTSKAQNVNAALAHVGGEFVGIFDADHHPDPGSFKRAWRWLSNGYDVVQGHCQVRNGEASWVSRLVAVEFEAIYAVSHPGRTRFHKFGIFGGSNGYWKTDLLRQTRMHAFMLTEDIDSSLRAVISGSKIASDPHLVSRELAPVTLKALWNQRMRWAQGWFQVSLKHIWPGLRSSQLSLRQKLGLFQLLAWREIYSWLSLQIFPVIAFWAWKYGGLDKLNWAIPIFLLTTIFTFSVCPGQTLFAYLMSAPEIKRRKGWYLFYLFMSLLFYTEFKNLISRVAHLKELMQERQWKVTPRTASVFKEEKV